MVSSCLVEVVTALSLPPQKLHDATNSRKAQSNILMDKRGEPRLAGFGLSKLMTEVQGITTSSGSVRWMARELIEAESVAPSFTRESDIWAFGMTMLVCVLLGWLRLYSQLVDRNFTHLFRRTITSEMRRE